MVRAARRTVARGTQKEEEVLSATERRGMPSLGAQRSVAVWPDGPDVWIRDDRRLTGRLSRGRLTSTRNRCGVARGSQPFVRSPGGGDPLRSSPSRRTRQASQRYVTRCTSAPDDRTNAAGVVPEERATQLGALPPRPVPVPPRTARARPRARRPTQLRHLVGTSWQVPLDLTQRSQQPPAVEDSGAAQARVVVTTKR